MRLHRVQPGDIIKGAIKTGQGSLLLAAQHRPTVDVETLAVLMEGSDELEHLLGRVNGFASRGLPHRSDAEAGRVVADRRISPASPSLNPIRWGASNCPSAYAPGHARPRAALLDLPRFA